MSKIVNLAKFYAIAAHTACGQVRKQTGNPYWHHCSDVASGVADFATKNADLYSYEIDENMKAAAWLHDVVEDTAITLDDLTFAFGTDIANYVKGLTKADSEEETIQILSNAGIPVKIIKLCDIRANLMDCIKFPVNPEFANGFSRKCLRVLKKVDWTDLPILGIDGLDLFNEVFTLASNVNSHATQ